MGEVTSRRTATESSRRFLETLPIVLLIETPRGTTMICHGLGECNGDQRWLAQLHRGRMLRLGLLSGGVDLSETDNVGRRKLSAGKSHFRTATVLFHCNASHAAMDTLLPTGGMIL
jgi:hypothetical protein